MKKDLRKEINPKHMGVRVSMGKRIRSGELVLSCSNEEHLEEVQKHIEQNWNAEYETKKLKIQKYRLKIFHLHKVECTETHKTLIEKRSTKHSCI